MAGYFRGTLSGIAGGIGQSDQSPQPSFSVMTYFWQYRDEGKTRTRFGRETSGELQYRFLYHVRNMVLRGDIDGGNAIEPDVWQGQQLSLVVQFDDQRTVTYTIEVDSFEYDSAQKDNDLWPFTLSAKVIGKPTYSDGWGTAVTSEDVDKDDVTTYGGSTTKDPATVAIVESSETIIDWYGGLSADTDAQVIARLVAAALAGTAPSGMKKRPSSINQDAPDGGEIHLRYGLNDSNDDVLNPHITRFTDPNGFDSTEETTALNTTPGSPTNTGASSPRNAVQQNQ